MRRQIPRYGFYCFRVHSCSAAYHFQVVLVREVEEEDVVRLAVDPVFYGVGLVGDEGGEDAEVAHSRDNVVPVGFAEVEVGFFGEEENRFQLPVLQAVDKFAENIFDDDLPVDVARVFQVHNYGAALVFGFQETLFKEAGFGYVVSEESRVHEGVEAAGERISDVLVAVQTADGFT